MKERDTAEMELDGLSRHAMTAAAVQLWNLSCPAAALKEGS